MTEIDAEKRGLVRDVLLGRIALSEFGRDYPVMPGEESDFS